MTETRPFPERGGTILALSGIVLTALGLRTAVAVLSPIADRIDEDVALGSIGLGVLGTMPPVAFAVFAVLTPAIVRRLGLERTMILALIASAIGHLVRGFAGSYASLLMGTIVVLIGLGIGNILMPPVVRRYFPSRIGPATAVVSVLLPVSTALPALLAEPIASSAGWRLALGMWSVLAIAALAPWIAIAVRQRRADDGTAVMSPPPSLLWALRRSPTAWAIGTVIAVSSIAVYSFFAWLPQILAERTSLDPLTIGALLSLFGFANLPTTLLMPILVARVRNVGPIVCIGVGFFLAGYLGLLLAADWNTWLWVLISGSGALLFPVGFTLIALRATTPAGSVALSGFSQALAYSFAALGPILVGVLHEATGSYTVPLILLLVLSLPGFGAAFVLRRHRTIEQDLGIAER